MDGTLADKEGAAMEKAEFMAVIDDQATNTLGQKLYIGEPSGT